MTKGNKVYARRNWKRWLAGVLSALMIVVTSSPGYVDVFAAEAEDVINEDELTTDEQFIDDDIEEVGNVIDESVSNDEASSSELEFNEDIIEDNEDFNTYIEETPEDETESADSSSAVIYYSGNYGDNIKWALDSSWVLTISGSGDMADYDYVNAPPWYSYRPDTNNIIVCDGIKSIGRRNFGELKNARSITLPEGLEHIGPSAFYFCASLSFVYIPDSVETIGDGAFTDCTSLSEIHLPCNLKTIPTQLFYYCKNLKQIDMPHFVEYIAQGAFERCSSLTALHLPGTVSSIGSNAFARCTSLTEISVPASLRSIGENAFSECTSLKDIYYSGDEGEWELIEGIENASIPDGTQIHFNSHHLEKISYVDSTCTETGIKEHYECTYCGKLFEDSEGQNELLYEDILIPSKGHINVIDESIPATCTESGLTEGSHCSVCGEVWTAQEEIPAIGHTLVTDTGKAATCTEKGLTEGSHCSTCGEVLVPQEEIPTTDHVVVIDDGIPASCTKPGVSTGRHCSICGKILEAQKTVPPTGHKIVSDSLFAATCTEPGMTQGTHCSECGKIFTAQEEISPTGHSFGAWKTLKESTQTEEGEQERECEICGFTEQQTIPKLISITPTIVLSKTEFTYNGDVQKPTITVKNGDDVLASDYYDVSFDDGLKDVGSYGITVDLKGEYSGSATASYKIVAKKITPAVTLSKTSFTYNGKAQKPAVTVKDGENVLSSDSYNISYDEGLTDAGTYKITIELKNNYKGSTAANYKIVAKKITPAVTLSKTSFTYNGKVQKPAVTVNNGTSTLKASNYAVTYASGLRNAGTYTVTVKMKGNFSGSATASYKIIPKRITPAITLSKTSFTYNGKTQKPSVTVKDGTTALTSSNYAVTYTSGLKNAGTYKITVTMNGNYSGTVTRSYKIVAKSVTPKVILSTTSYVYNGAVRKPGVTVKVGATKLAATAYTTTYAKGRKNVGTYKVTVKLKGNYKGTKTATFKITPKKITPSITLSKNVFVYNGQIQKPKITVKAGSTKLTTFDYTIAYAKGLKNVGTYTITIKLKRNYSGSKAVTYKINPEPAVIISAIGYYDRIVAQWSKKEAQTTGYQLQYSTDSKFSSTNKTALVANASTSSTTIKKPVKGKNYFVRVRTYKKIGSVMYYSTWSEGINTAIKQTIKAKQSLYMDNDYSAIDTAQEKVSYTFTTKQKMMFVVPITIDSPDGSERFRLVLKDANGKVHQNDIVSTEGYGSYDTYDGWYYNDTFLVPAGTYTYTLEITQGGYSYVTYSILGFLARSTSATIKSHITTQSGKWIKIGKLGAGYPMFSLSTSNSNIINNYEFELNGDLYVRADKKGKSTITVKLSNGKKYTSTVNVVAGEPDFDARITKYNTRDNYFEVEVSNHRPSAVTIIRKGARVEDNDYKSYDRKIKNASNVTIKSGETKYIRFYVDGNNTWPDYEDFTLFAKFIFEDVTYDWKVWYCESLYWKKPEKKWYTTYWVYD